MFRNSIFTPVTRCAEIGASFFDDKRSCEALLGMKQKKLEREYKKLCKFTNTKPCPIFMLPFRLEDRVVELRRVKLRIEMIEFANHIPVEVMNIIFDYKDDLERQDWSRKKYIDELTYRDIPPRGQFIGTLSTAVKEMWESHHIERLIKLVKDTGPKVIKRRQK